MIIRLENPLLVGKILDLAKVVPDTPINKLEKMLLSGINDKDSIIYIDDHDGEIRGFIYASQEFYQGEQVCFVQFCVVKPDKLGEYICFELLTKIRLWAKDRGIENLIFITKRNYKPFERKYGFNLDGYILKRKVCNHGKPI